eukprot:1571601-Pleurochrysis_carterae.AAC.2
MAPRKASARGGSRVGAGRPNPAAVSRQEHTQERSSNSARATRNQEEPANMPQSVPTRSSTAAGTSAAPPEHPPLSPVSRARAKLRTSAHLMSKADLLKAYTRTVNQRNYAWRRIRRLLKDAEGSKSSSSSMHIRKTQARFGSSDKAVHDRRHRLAKTLSAMMRLRPVEDHAHAVNAIIQAFSVEQRAELRKLTALQQERFLAQRDLCQLLRSQHFTPKGSLSIRLDNFLPTRALDRANTVLSKVQDEDGTWRRPILLSMPSGCRTSNRALGICSPLRMFNVLSLPREIAAALDEVVTPFGELSVGGNDFNTAAWDIRTMASSVLAAAAAFNNLRDLSSTNPLISTRKIQLQFDGMSWTRGHGCTRLIVRTPCLLTEFNSPFFSRDCLFYIGGDKCKDLAANLRVGGDASIHNVLLQSMQFSPSSDARVPQ